MANTKTVLRSLSFVAFNLVVAIALLESVLLLLLHAPRITAASPAPVRRLAQQAYRHFNRNLIQFDPECARYDPDVTYTLRPGTCAFDNIEFRNQIRVNRLGLRDDESALEGPEVVVLGDSHAMGWGVDQDETFARVAARNTGLKVLNAAVSSYGTVRELTMLDRLDTSRLRVLVIQYSDNDVVENGAFRAHDNHLPITSRTRYDEIVRYYRSQRSYYPGKYVVRLFLKLSRLERPEPDNPTVQPMRPADEAALFLNALQHAGRTPLDRVQVVALDIDQDFQHPRSFIAALGEASRRAENPPFVRQLVTLDTTAVIKPDDFYVLDDHMTARGHARIGEALGSLIERLTR